jgi:predicted nucleic acid-binding protein
VISAERAGETPGDLIARVARTLEDQSVAISAIGYTELAHGKYRAANNLRRAMRRGFLDGLTAQLPVYPYTVESAEIAARIDAEQKAQGIVIPFADLLIGATALSLGFSVLTANLRHFRLIPGLEVIPF